MINKNFLFIIVSIILGLIVSYYYNQKLNKDFYLYFVMTSVIFYILFYFLADNKGTYENFSNTHQLNEYKERKNSILQNIYSQDEHVQHLQQMIDNLEQEDIGNIPGEEMHNYNNYPYYKTELISEEEEETQSIPITTPPTISTSTTSTTTSTTPITQMEEESSYPLSLVPTSESGGNGGTTGTSNVPEEETFTYPNLKNMSLQNPLGNGPLNINISYNAQNSTNNLNDGIGGSSQCGLTNPIKPPSKNLGPIGNCGLTRIYNNSDWIYGSNAWTNDPDYYIPTKDCPSPIVPKNPIPLNEVSMRKLQDGNDVCPLEINTPWSEWKSGDSDPEPFNL